MEYKHIDDCWNAIKEAETIEEVEKLFDGFPRWSGDWDWYESDDGFVVVENCWYDKTCESFECDRETLDIMVGIEEDDEYGRS